MSTHSQRETVMTSIADHLRAVGPHDWGKFMALWPEVPPRTMWRWIKEVRQAQNILEPSPGGAVSARRAEAVDEVTAFDVMSCHPLQRLIRELRSDADLLHAQSMNSDGTIKNVRLFERVAKMKISIFHSASKLDDTMRYWELILEGLVELIVEVHKEHPPTGVRLMEKLAHLKDLYSAREKAGDVARW